MSALQSGAPNQVAARCLRRHPAGGLRRPCFDDALGPIDRFQDLGRMARRGCPRAVIDREPRLTVGWATKIINVYLKTRVYIGGQGRHHLKEMIHPPIDAGLWLGLKRRFPESARHLDRDPLCQSDAERASLTTSCYRRIIDGCRAAAKAIDCELIEVEQLWAGTEFAPSVPATAADIVQSGEPARQAEVTERGPP